MPLEILKKNDTKDNSKRRQPFLNTKYGFIGDKNDPHCLRRDLLLSNFDRNMIVEKARFETCLNEEQEQNDHIPRIDVIPDQGHSTDTETTLVGSSSPSAPTYTLTTVPSAPTLSASNDHTLPLRIQKSCSTTTMNDPKKVKQVRSESHLNSYTHRNPDKKLMKKQSKPIIHGNASPAEVFHRNLVDAVSNAEDSDENEHYVYPYSSNENLAATHAMHRPISVRSTPPTYLQHDITKKNYGTHNSSSGLGEWLKQTLYHSKPPRRQQHHFDEEEEDLCWSGNEQYRRPKLRNHVKDHLLQQNKPSLLNLWRESFNKKHTHNLLPTKKNRNPPQYATLPRKFSPYYCSATGRDGYEGYTSDDEEAPLLSRRQKRSSRPKKSCSTLPNLFLSLLTALIFLMVIVFYRAQPLVELTVDIGRVLATDKELIFDLKVQAENWNWWTIHIADADISVFAFSQIVPSELSTEMDKTHSRGVDPAEYLGNVRHFDEPLSIQSRQFGHNTKEAITLIRIKSPGADSSGNERWSRMIRYPYGLVVRGVLKYRPIPFAVGMYPQSIAICNVTRVDPTTGTVSTDPDRTICANEDEVDIFSHVMRGTAL